MLISLKTLAEIIDCIEKDSELLCAACVKKEQDELQDDDRWDQLRLDIMENMPNGVGKQYILAAMDRLEAGENYGEDETNG